MPKGLELGETGVGGDQRHRTGGFGGGREHRVEGTQSPAALIEGEAAVEILAGDAEQRESSSA